jgi:hypothetical protein
MYHATPDALEDSVVVTPRPEGAAQAIEKLSSVVRVSACRCEADRKAFRKAKCYLENSETTQLDAPVQAAVNLALEILEALIGN